MRLAVLAVPLVLLAGCVPAQARLVTDSETFAVVAPPADHGMDALLVGTVVLDDDHCWAVEVEDAGIRQVMWPEGTYLEDGLRLPGFDAGFAAGDAIELGGGELTSAEDHLPCWAEGEIYWLVSPA
ncbi:MAG TPA: hypothetical protein VNR36_03105 [Pseudolysinimonas sp.]|nr:hypothetical protein [Pseudolysinimonas sp.]